MSESDAQQAGRRSARVVLVWTLIMAGSVLIGATVLASPVSVPGRAVLIALEVAFLVAFAGLWALVIRRR